MIKPEQVPDEVVKTLEQALLGRPLSARNCTAAIAAALNAWPGAMPKLDGRYYLLPLTQENNT